MNPVDESTNECKVNTFLDLYTCFNRYFGNSQNILKTQFFERKKIIDNT